LVFPALAVQLQGVLYQLTGLNAPLLEALDDGV
jgi:hypothetical protein